MADLIQKMRITTTRMKDHAFRMMAQGKTRASVEEYKEEKRETIPSQETI